MRAAPVALALVACASTRPCPGTLPSATLHQVDSPGDTITFYVADLPGEHGRGAVTFAVYLREDAQPLGMSFETRMQDGTPPRCDDVSVFVDGHRIDSHVVAASTVDVTPHDDGISMTSVRFDVPVHAGDESCVEIVACGASYPLPAGAGAQVARLVAAR